MFPSHCSTIAPSTMRAAIAGYDSAAFTMTRLVEQPTRIAQFPNNGAPPGFGAGLLLGLPGLLPRDWSGCWLSMSPAGHNAFLRALSLRSLDRLISANLSANFGSLTSR